IIKPLDLPATLFRTTDEWSGPHDYGWGALTRQLSIVNIEGTHLEMFEPQHLDGLRDRIVEAIELAAGEAGAGAAIRKAGAGEGGALTLASPAPPRRYVRALSAAASSARRRTRTPPRPSLP